MYPLIAILSLFIRTYILDSTPSLLSLTDIFREFILWIVTYSIVGLHYGKNSSSTYGSLLYLFFYIVHSIILALLVSFDWKLSVIIISFVAYSIINVVISKLSSVVLEFRRWCSGSQREEIRTGHWKLATEIWRLYQRGPIYIRQIKSHRHAKANKLYKRNAA